MSSALMAVTAVMFLDSASAQQPERLMIDVGACVVLQADEERFACYEERVNLVLRQRWSMETGDREPGQTARVEETPSVSAQPQAAAPTASAVIVAERQPAVTESGDTYATITEVRETVPNRVIVTLDNGQIWRQTASASYPLRVGHLVRIYRGAMGGDRLAVEELGGFIRVERVR
jgi:hypothetical protein